MADSAPLPLFAFLLQAVFIYRGGRFFGQRFQQRVFVVCGVFLVVLSVRFGMEGIGALVHDLG